MIVIVILKSKTQKNHKNKHLRYINWFNENEITYITNSNFLNKIKRIIFYTIEHKG